MRISIRPFGDVPSGLLEDLVGDLAPLGAAEVRESAPLRREWFDAAKGKFRADPFLDAVAGDPGHRALAVTAADVYREPYNFVFGVARTYDRPALLSVARLASPDPKRFRERVAKEAVHELGHTLGCDNCENPECVMSFSDSVDEVDRKTSAFCRRCRVTVDFTLKRLRT